MIKNFFLTLVAVMMLVPATLAADPEKYSDDNSYIPNTPFFGKISDNFSLSSTLRYRYLVDDPYTKRTQNYFYFQRGYITMKYKFNDKIRARFTMDFDHTNRVALRSASIGTGGDLTTSTVNANDGTRGRIKYAYLEMDDFLGLNGLTATFGNYEQPGPQDYHNTIENSWLDRYYTYGFSSAVTGAMLTYNFPEKWGYVRAAVANYNGYGSAGDNNKAKNFISDIWIKPPGTGITVFGWTMIDYYAANNNEAHNNVFGGGLEYKLAKMLDVGGEVDFAKNSVSEIKAASYMGYVNYSPLPELMFVGQVGMMDNDTDTSDDEMLMIIGGFNYEFVSDTYIMFNLINESFKVGGESKSNMRYNFQLLVNF